MKRTEGSSGALADPALGVRAIIDSVKDYAIFLLTPEGYIASWSEGAESIKGYTEREIVGSHVSRFYTPEDLAAGKPARLLEAARRDGRVEDESWRVRKDGTRFWADVVISAIRDEAGELRGYVKVTRDLTQRRAAAESLRQSEERLRLMLDSVKDYAIFLLDTDGVVVSWNPGAERLKGYRADEIIGRHFSVFYPQEEIDAHRPEVELRAAAEHERLEQEGWRVRKDGSRFWASVLISAARDVSGTLIGYTKVTRDVSDRRRAEQELAAHARQQAAIADLGQLALKTRELELVARGALERVRDTLAVDGAVLLDRANDVTTVRAAVGAAPEVASALAALGVVTTGESVVLGHAQLGPLAAHGIRSAAAAAVPRGAGLGCASIAVVSSAPREFSDGEVHFLEAVGNVVATAEMRRAAEEKLREAERRTELERMAVKEREEFISVAAHELRTPLTALALKLNGAGKVLRRDVPGEAGEKLAERIVGALRQADRLNVLVGRLLDVSRIGSGALHLTPEAVDLGVLAAEVVGDFAEEAISSRAPISFRADGNTLGVWDRARLEQALVNLLSNALKYGAGAPIDVVVDGSAPDEVRIDVTDRGIGIDAGDRERIFRRFQRAASLRHYGGLGLGLYITRSLVEAHGGTIDVESAPGAGATFRMRLPRRVSTQGT